MRHKFHIQISIMLWYSFILKHLHAEIFFVSLTGFTKYKRTSHTLASFLFIYLLLFLEWKKAKKKEKKRMGECVIVERVWVNEVERERESQQSLFSHILSWQHHAKREMAGIALMWLLCSPASILTLSLHPNVYTHYMAKCSSCECIEYFFALLDTHSFRLSRLNNIFLCAPS